MLQSVTISRRQSEIRQALAALAAKPEPTEDETRSMTDLDAEYGTNETRLRAALIAEDTERRDAGAVLETRGDREWSDLIGRFELRQVALALDEGRQLEGATAEVVSELRSSGGYRGVPIPWAALETRAGETMAADVPAPRATRPILDRLFPASVAARMGAEMISVDSGQLEAPVVSSTITAAWQGSETGAVAGPTPFTTAERSLAPDFTLGVQVRITRRALKQAGAALEAAIRRDLSGAISSEMDRAAFLGAGLGGQPLGIITGAAAYGITATDIDAAASWAAFRAAIARFLTANAATAASEVRVLLRPEVWAALDDTANADLGMTEWARLVEHVGAGNVVLSSNAIAAPSGDPAASAAVLATSAGGVAPFYIGTWGAIDIIRDPYSDAQTGGLRVTALATMDVAPSRPQQLEVLTGLEAV
jgi:HK97 family phage major capsid protein